MAKSKTEELSPVPRLLLRPKEAAAALGIGLTTLCDNRAKLAARGVLRMVKIGNVKRYDYAALKRAVDKAAEREEPLA